MITVRKFRTLPPDQQLRKAVLIVKTFEKDAALAVRPDTKLYFKEFGACLLPRITSVRREAFASQFQSSLQSLRRDDAAAFRRNCNALRYLLLNELGVETADWDFPADEGRGERSVLPMRVYLEDIRSPFNVGSIFRTAESFGIEMIYLSPGCPGPEHPRCRRSAMGTADTVPRQKTRLEDLIGTSAIPVTSIFALETGGCDLDRFIFPSDGLVLLGSEELGLSPRALEYADKGAGRVSIPLYGTKASLNVAVAFAIMVRQWYKYLTDSVQSHK